MLIVFSGSVATVKAFSGKTARLDPIALQDGTFILPERILVDPDYSTIAPLAGTFTKRAVDWSEVTWNVNASIKNTGTIQEYDTTGKLVSSGTVQTGQAVVG